VKLGQFKKKVAKEFAKSPAKTFALIALCPVALYFVVPLFLPKKPTIDEAQRVKVIAPNSKPVMATFATASATVTQLPVSVGPNWEQLNRWIEADARRKSGTIASDQRNPFQAVPVEMERTETVAANDDPPVEPVRPPELTQERFEALGLKLTGTMLGRRSRSATINGRRYVEGAKVSPVDEDGRASADGHVFVLKRVGPHLAILEMQGLQFRLELNAARGLGTGITVVRKQRSLPN